MNTTNVISLYNANEFNPNETEGVESVINAVVLANGSCWKEEFKSLMQEVKNLCLMPNDVKCVKAYLSANAFVHQPGITKYVRVNDVISYMNDFCHDGQEAIVSLRGMSKEYVLISANLPQTVSLDETSRYHAYGYRAPGYRTDIADIWVRWSDREDHSPIKRRRGAAKPKKTHKSLADHACFHYCQKNPKNLPVIV